MPAVLDDEEIPFVIGFVDDPRRAVEVGGAQYRRGQTGYSISWPIGELWLRARAMTVGPGQVAVIASAGPILNDWWSLLRSAPQDPTRPLLSAGVARRSVDVPLPSMPAVPVMVVPASDDFPQTVAMCTHPGGIADDETLTLFHWASLGVVKAAVRLLVEYRELVGEPPEVDVGLGEGGTVTIPLADVLATAAEITAALDPGSASSST